MSNTTDWTELGSEAGEQPEVVSAAPTTHTHETNEAPSGRRAQTVVTAKQLSELSTPKIRLFTTHQSTYICVDVKTLRGYTP